MNARYDSEARTMNDPTKAEKAVLEPMYTSPRTVFMIAHANVALSGFPHWWFTCEIQVDQGVAPSLPRVHSIRPVVI
jgi:hypothetical protein